MTTRDPALRRPVIWPRVTPDAVKRALETAWTDAFDAAPPAGAIALLMAHQAHETGRWRSMPCYNLGGIRPSSPSHAWYAVSAFEDLSEAEAQRWAARSTPAAPCRLGVQLPGGRRRVHVGPDHPCSIFRAYDSLDDACREYLAKLHGRFRAAWPAVLAGDPVAFVSALKAQRYFTASEESYRAAIVPLFAEFNGRGTRWIQDRLRVAGFDPGPIDGVLGPRTRAALTAFQRTRGLVADGLPGARTLAALEGVSGVARGT
jgi:hypothetical protein